MKITYFDGCRNSSFQVDGEEFNRLNPKHVQAFMGMLLEYLDKADKTYLEIMVKDVLQEIGRVDYDEYCETCGDNNTEYSLELEG